jgi:hypothetical protein
MDWSSSIKRILGFMLSSGPGAVTGKNQVDPAGLVSMNVQPCFATGFHLTG